MNLFETGIKLASATERTARAVIPMSGKDDKHGADHLAVEELRQALNELDLNMKVVIGEGEKDDAPMLYAGETLGQKIDTPDEPQLDLIVDPLECTTNFARGLPDSMSVLAAAPAGAFQEVPGTYMEQLLLPPGVLEKYPDLDLDTPVGVTLERVSEVLGRPVRDITIIVQDRPRHQKLVADIRAAGAGVALIESGSISAALEIMNLRARRLVMLWGIFGAPEGLVIALMARQFGYGFLARIKPHNEESTRQTAEMGLTNRTLKAEEWIRSPGVLVLSGIHSSPTLRGVEYVDGADSLRVYSLVWAPDKRYLTVHRDGVLESQEIF